MKKIIILPLLLLSASSVFGMEPADVHMPNAYPAYDIETLKERLKNLKQMKTSVLNNTLHSSVFIFAGQQLYQDATNSHHTKIAKDAKIVYYQAVKRLRLMNSVQPTCKKRLFDDPDNDDLMEY